MAFDLHVFRDRERRLCVSFTSPGGRRSGSMRLPHAAEHALYVLVALTIGDDVAREWLRT